MLVVGSSVYVLCEICSGVSFVPFSQVLKRDLKKKKTLDAEA